MKITDPKRMQIQWRSAPLAVLLSVALFFILDSFGVSDELNGTLRSFLNGATTVALFFGINIVAANRRARKKP
ncbi:MULTISPECIES: hypothetical protein [Xenorhabdus]|uniref:hypothetical protein n=1 Tax=Xenorhabdus TaxID=626 RepID=UPI0006478DBB|nr:MULTISPECIES: hypothetical protein [Xenorhabdus]